MAPRAATTADAERLAEIYGHYVRTSVATFDEVPPTPAEMAAKVTDVQRAGLPFLVAEGERDVDAFAYLASYRPRSAYRFTAETSVYVASEARGRGHGRRLLGELVALAPSCGLRELVAVIAVTEDPASVALHRRCGFADAGLLTGVGFKHGRWLDTLVLQLSLR